MRWAIRLATAVLGALMVVAAHQFGCAWFGPTTVTCHMSGACLPEMVCPAALPGLHRLHRLYTGYVRALVATTQSTPALTCLKHRLAAVASSSEVATPLREVYALESAGLGIAADTRKLMRDIETTVIGPIHDFADITEDALVNSSENVGALKIELLNTVIAIGSAITVAATDAVDISVRMDAYAGDVRAFGGTLRHYHVPKLQNHRDAKVPDTAKYAGVTLLVGGAAAAICSGPITALSIAYYAGPPLAAGIIGSFTVSHYEAKWAADGMVVRDTGYDIHHYSDLIDSGVKAIVQASKGLDDIHSGLIALRDTMGLTLDPLPNTVQKAKTPQDVTKGGTPDASPDVTTTWATRVLEVVRRLRTETDAVQTAIAVERRNLIATRNHVHITDASACH